MSAALNLMNTTTNLGSFETDTNGIYQGTVYDDPAARNTLDTATLAITETLPMWGGCATYEAISTGTGRQIGRATSAAMISGFSLFNQADAFFNTPYAPVPTALPGATVPIARLQSRLRLTVQIDPALVSLDGGLVTQQVSWDLVNQRLVAFNGTTLPVIVLGVFGSGCMVVSFDGSNSTWNRNGAAAVILV